MPIPHAWLQAGARKSCCAKSFARNSFEPAPSINYAVSPAPCESYSQYAWLCMGETCLGECEDEDGDDHVAAGGHQEGVAPGECLGLVLRDAHGDVGHHDLRDAAACVADARVAGIRVSTRC